MKNNRLILLDILIACFPFFLQSQSNTVIDEILNEDKADCGETSCMKIL